MTNQPDRDAQGGEGGRCCDMHNRNCEPPSELCCGECTEIHHGIHADPPNFDRTLGRHHDGSVCIDPDLSAQAGDLL
jgi:hypothetical protein